MDKKIAGLLGAVAALGGLNAAQAAPAPVQDPTNILQANSFAELLEPIANAAELLRAVEAQQPAEATVQEAQYYPYYRHHHHHHHHHHAFYPRYYAPYGGEVVVVPRYRHYYRHHHHHHHHHGFYRYY